MGGLSTVCVEGKYLLANPGVQRANNWVVTPVVVR